VKGFYRRDTEDAEPTQHPVYFVCLKPDPHHQNNLTQKHEGTKKNEKLKF